MTPPFPVRKSNGFPREQMGAVVPGWLWMLALVSIGGFGALVVYMENYQSNKVFTADSNTSPKKSSAELNQSIDKNKATTFDFYSLLPELEKIIPDREAGQYLEREQTVAIKAPPQLKPSEATLDAANNLNRNNQNRPSVTPLVAPKIKSSGRYYLQAGSFKEFKAADSRRASLALIGIISKIQNADIPNRGLWYRVRIGPFVKMTEMRRVRKLLNKNNIVSIMLTVKK